MEKSNWNTDIVHSRIMDSSEKKRYAAGSPDSQEISVYARCLPANSGLGVVLGMTPELRNMAASHCGKLLSIDHSEASISTYKDWLSPELKNKEEIICGDWSVLENALPEPPDFILGDGIFGNVIPLEKYSSLLQIIRSSLAPQGCFVTRQCLMPEEVLDNPRRHQDLLEKFRQGMLDEAGFGLSMRLHGYVDVAYDKKTCLLDNRKVFAKLDADYKSGLLSLLEYQVVRRYLFNGINSIPPQGKWEELLKENGFKFKQLNCQGKYWYHYYPIYSCRLG